MARPWSHPELVVGTVGAGQKCFAIGYAEWGLVSGVSPTANLEGERDLGE